MQHVERRLDEEHLEVWVQLEQLANEELVATPHVVPGLEGEDHQLRMGDRGSLVGQGQGRAAERAHEPPSDPPPSARGRGATATRQGEQQDPDHRAREQRETVREERAATTVLEQEPLRPALEVLEDGGVVGDGARSAHVPARRLWHELGSAAGAAARSWRSASSP